MDVVFYCFDLFGVGYVDVGDGLYYVGFGVRLVDYFWFLYYCMGM